MSKDSNYNNMKLLRFSSTSQGYINVMNAISKISVSFWKWTYIFYSISEKD